MVDKNDRGFRLYGIGGEVGHDFALERVDEAAAESERTDFAAIDGDFFIGAGSGEHRNLVVLGDLQGGQHVGAGDRAEHGNDFILGDQFGDGIGCFGRFGFVVGQNQFQLLAVDAAGRIDFLERQLDAVDGLLAKVGDAAGQFEVAADFDFV